MPRQFTQPRPPQIAVIVAGISGLMCARTLADNGLGVTVFKKSRGGGGRMATRRIDEGLQVDHGAQYFAVRDDRFARFVESWVREGIVAPWHRWRYAIPAETLEGRCLFDHQRKIGACDDWCGGPRVEGAFLSGMSVAEQVLSNLTSGY